MVGGRATRILKRVLAPAEHVQFLLSLGIGTALAFIAGGVIWVFASFPLVFKLGALVGVGIALVGLVFELASRLAPLVGGVTLSLRTSVLSTTLKRLEDSGGVLGALPVGREACFASLVVYNEREFGGDRAKARGVVPQVEIFDHDGTRIVEHVGWDIGSERDFLPNREQHRLYVVGKWKDEEDCFFVQGSLPNENSVGARCLVQGTYDVRITLRGKNLRRPIEKWFLLSNQGIGHCARLSASGI